MLPSFTRGNGVPDDAEREREREREERKTTENGRQTKMAAT